MKSKMNTRDKKIESNKKTAEAAQSIVDQFRNPNNLPKALANIFIDRVCSDKPQSNWSWNNQFLAAIRTSDARGCKQWNKVNRTVKEDAKAFYILGPCKFKVKDKITGDDIWIVKGFRPIPVFKIEDTEGEDLPEVKQDNPFIESLPFLDVAKTWGIDVGLYNGAGQSALGFFGRDSEGNNQHIKLGVENLKVWAHEMIHASDFRLTKLTGNKCTLETVAELGGAVLLSLIGEDEAADLGGAYEYIKRHATKNKKTASKVCMEVIDRVCSCVDLILAEIPETEPSECAVLN